MDERKNGQRCKPKKKYTSLYEVKKSKFAATAFPAETEQEAMDEIKQVSDPGASHNSWAFKIGGIHKYSDDKEPRGTAGRPIYNAIEAKGFDLCGIVVTRYFGGVKLGTGGLTRAYGHAASLVLDSCPGQVILTELNLTIKLPHDRVNVLHHLKKLFGYAVLEENYTEAGLSAVITIDGSKYDEFVEKCTEMSGGKVEISLF